LICRKAFELAEHTHTELELRTLEKSFKESAEDFYRQAWPKSVLGKRFYSLDGKRKALKGMRRACAMLREVSEQGLLDLQAKLERRRNKAKLEKWMEIGPGLKARLVFNIEKLEAICDSLNNYNDLLEAGIDYEGFYDPRDPIQQTNDILWIDDCGANLLKSFGPVGLQKAHSLKTNATQRWKTYEASKEAQSENAIEALWKIWLPHQNALMTDDGASNAQNSSGIKANSDKASHEANEAPFFAVLLAYVIWCDVLHDKISRSDSAGVAMPIVTTMIALSTRGVQQNEKQDHIEIFDFKRKRIGSLIHPTPTLGGDIVKIEALTRLSTQRLLRFLMWESYEKKWIRNDPEPGRIVVEGGISALLKRLGINSSKQEKEIREALDTLSALWINTPKGEGQVFAHHWHRSHTGKKAWLEMVLLGPLAPDYIARELAGHRIPSDKYLVPVPLPKMLPPLVGRPADHGSQANLQLLALRELRIHAEEYAEKGHVGITDQTWRQLADEAALPKKILPLVLQAYIDGTEDYPPFLSSPTRSRYHLTTSYEAEKRTIVAAGAAQNSGRKRGKASVRKRKA
jgi:hypothetical protein